MQNTQQTSKLKTLKILEYLNKYSDEYNPLSTTDLIELLERDGLRGERKSIYTDIKTLNDIGFEILKTEIPKRGYFMNSRSFEVPEVRLLIDAVNSAGFITPDKSASLIGKLKELLSVNQAEMLAPQVYCEGTNKCDNEEIYYIIDALDEAIHKKKQVKFIYKKRNIDKENVKSFTTKTFTVSPYALIWKDDRYYLVCNKMPYDNLMNLRLDRMRRIQILEENARPVSECSGYESIFDVSDYASKMFNMFSGEVETVRLICSLDLREQILDRFGAKIPLRAIDINTFETSFEAAVSDGLVSWIMQFGAQIKVTEPQYLADMVKEKAISILSNY